MVVALPLTKPSCSMQILLGKGGDSMAKNCGCKTKPKGPKTVRVKSHKRRTPRKC